MNNSQPTESSNRTSRLVIAAVLVLLPLVYFLPVFIWNLTLVPGDGLTQNFGVRILIGRMLAAGQLPLWNPYIFAGTPLLASIYPGALYPPNWVFAVFSPTVAMNIVVVTTYHLALIGTYLYARKIGATRIGALLAGLAFTFGGYLVAHAGHTSRIAAAVWLPWILLAIEHLYLQFRWRWVTLGAAFIALQLFAGEPQMNFYTVLVCAAYGAFSLAFRPACETRLRFLGGAVAMSVFGLLFSMMQLLPERELLAMGERAGISYEYFSGYSFPPLNVLTFIFPFFFGGGMIEPYRIPYWGQSTIDEACGYVGLLTLLLALAALFGSRYGTASGSDRTKLIRFWSAAAAISLVLAFGAYLPFGLNHVLHRLPIYNLFRASGRHMYEFTFSLAILAGLGASLLAQLDRETALRVYKKAGAVFTTIVVVTLLAYGFVTGHIATSAYKAPGFDSLTNLEVWLPLGLALLSLAVFWFYVRTHTNFSAGLLVALLFADLFVFTVSFNYGWRDFLSNVGERLNDPPAVQFIKSRERDLNSFRVASYGALLDKANYDQLNFPNVSIARGLQSVNGYDALRLIRHGAISGEMGSDGVIGDVAVIGKEHQGFNLQNVKYLLIPKTNTNAPDKVVEFDGVRFSRQEVYQNFLPGTRMEVSVGGVTATELAMETLMSHATHVPDGTTVLIIKLHTKDGRVIEQELQAGRDTAEWAYDKPEVTAAIKHRRPKVAEFFPADGFAANRFLARLPFDRADIERIELDYALPDATLLLIRASLFDAQTKTSTPLEAIDFHFERWKRLAAFGDVLVYENLQARPRAWFVNRLAVELSKDVLATIKSGKFPDGSRFNPADVALLEKEDFGNRPITLPEIGEATNATVNVTRYEPNRIELETRNSSAGFLVLSEMYYRGWEAWLDGKRIPVEKVNYLLRGVAVPAGDHRIEFVYRAHSFRNGATWSLAGIVLLLACVVAGRFGGGVSGGNLLARLSKPLVARSSRVLTVVLVAVLVVYAIVLATRASYAVGGSDSSGYANIARSLLQGPIAQPLTDLKRFGLGNEYAGFFTPLGYVPKMKDGGMIGTMVPIYPVGFPLHIAAATLLVGWSYGPFLISPLFGALSLGLFYLLARDLGLSHTFAAAGCLLLAVNPTFLYMAFQPMSDVAALCWCLTAIWAAWRARQNDRWALLAGAAFGMAFMVRPTDILLLAPLAFCLPLKPKPWLMFVLGGLPLAVVFGAYNLAAYGHALQTGYGEFNIGNLISPTGSGDRFRFYLNWLTLTLSPLLLVGWLGVAALLRLELRIRAMLMVWFGAFFVFFVCYDVYGAWWYTRFLLPGYPGLLLGALLTARECLARLAQHHRVMGWVAATACLLIPLGFELHHNRKFEIWQFGRNTQVQAESCRWVDARLPANALIVSEEMSGALKFYTKRPIVRWDYVTAEMWPRLESQVRQAGYQFYAMLLPHELDKARQVIPGQWTELGRMQHISLWQIQTTNN